ncbi:hypothetical protein I4U23_005243 [Adineta vaga]|nr:hypothetical protein I4U23_005243 [Adineta vaga]
MLSDDLKDLINQYAGLSFPYSKLSSIITNIEIEDNLCIFQFQPEILNYCHNQLFISELSQVKTILSIEMSFHDQYNNIIIDNDGNLLHYTSNLHDLGYILDILNQEIPFHYIKCLLHLRSNSNFNFNNLFFHFPHLSSRLPSINMGFIKGPIIFSLDFNEQIYNVSIQCPSDCTCMWLLDDEIISSESDSSVTLTFHEKNIGNRTLSYVKYIANRPTNLASLLLSILPKSIETTTFTIGTSILTTTTSNLPLTSQVLLTCDMNCTINYNTTYYYYDEYTPSHNESGVISCADFCANGNFDCHIVNADNPDSCNYFYPSLFDDGSRFRRGNNIPPYHQIDNKGNCIGNSSYYCCCTEPVLDDYE